MKQEKEKIDILLERNASEQLAGVNWEELNTAISQRLNQAQQSKTSIMKYRRVFKIAAGVAAAAAVVLIAVMVRTDTPTTVQFENGGKAVVKFVESKGSASVELKHTSTKAAVMVDGGAGLRRAAKCDIEIIDTSVDKEKNGRQAAWIIIRMPEPVLADNGQSRDEADFACLM